MIMYKIIPLSEPRPLRITFNLLMEVFKIFFSQANVAHPVADPPAGIIVFISLLDPNELDSQHYPFEIEYNLEDLFQTEIRIFENGPIECSIRHDNW